MRRAIRQTKKNLETLQTYRQLPNDLYEYIHAWDSYLLDITSFAQKFVRQMTGWMQRNANRYAEYVDFIILMIGIIETRQPLIDFSTNWTTKCARCTVDNYDFYSCKLSMLCVDLPILPIPPFKIPDLFIDFSQINL